MGQNGKTQERLDLSKFVHTDRGRVTVTKLVEIGFRVWHDLSTEIQSIPGLDRKKETDFNGIEQPLGTKNIMRPSLLQCCNSDEF